MKLEVISPEEWRESFSEMAHLIVFEKHKPSEWDRIDFALMAVDEEKVPCGYVTCREFDPHTLYWQFGGAFPGTKGTSKSHEVCALFTKWSLEHYQRVLTFIENTNLKMLKMALGAGFLICGVRVAGDSILVEHCLEKKE